MSHPFGDIEQVVSRDFLASFSQVVDPPVVVEEQFDVTEETPRPNLKGGLSWSETADVSVAGTSYCQKALDNVAHLPTQF